MPNKPNNTKNVKKRNKKKGNMIAVIVIIIAIIITVIVVNKNKNTENNNKEAVNQKQVQEAQKGLAVTNNEENVKLENGIKENTSKEISKNRTIEGIEVTDINLYAKEGISNFSATIKNNSGKDFKGKSVKLHFTNNDGSDYAILEAYIPEMKNGETNYINAGTTADIINAYDFTFELEK